MTLPRSRALLALASLALLPLAGACAAAPVRDGAFEETRSWSQPGFSAVVFAQEHELDDVEFEDDLRTILGTGINDVERQRVGIRVSVGVDNVQGYVQLFAEEWDDFDGSDLRPMSAVSFDDLFGIGVGARGTPVLRRLRDGVSVVLPYRAGVNLVQGDGRFTDTAGGSLLVAPTTEGDLAYFEQEFSVGLGLNVRGFQPSVGLYGSFFAGLVDDEIVANSANDELEFEASNSGVFVQLEYAGTDVPITFGVRGTVGNVEGVEGFFGVAL